MKTVFILQHSYELSDTGEEKARLIGVYSCKENAEKAVEGLSKQLEFKDSAEYFSIDEYQIDQDIWSEGCITKT